MSSSKVLKQAVNCWWASKSIFQRAFVEVCTEFNIFANFLKERLWFESINKIFLHQVMIFTVKELPFITYNSV